MNASVAFDTISNIVLHTIPNIQRIVDDNHVEYIYNTQKEHIDNNIGLTVLQSITVCKLENTMYVIDGQHRIKVFIRLIEDQYDISNVNIPVVMYEVSNMTDIYDMYRLINYNRNINSYELSDQWVNFGKILCENMKNKFPSYIVHLSSGNKRVNIPKITFEKFELALENREKCLNNLDPVDFFNKIVLINDNLINARKLITKECKLITEECNFRKYEKCENHKREKDEDVLYLSIFGDDYHGYLDIVIYMIHNNYESLDNIENLVSFEFFNSKTKNKIPPRLREQVWNKINEGEIGKCYVCSISIEKSDFHCGHIVARHIGGKDNIDNLLPICRSCNLSMGIQNLYEYKSKYF